MSQGFLVNKQYSRLWAGQAISTVGDYVFDTALVIWVATEVLPDSQWAPAAVSGIMFCVIAATITVGPAAGVFVDRWPYKRTMQLSEQIRALVMLVLVGATFLPARFLNDVAWIVIVYVAVFITTASGQFFNPSRFATIALVVHSEEGRARATGIGQATMSTAAILGPPLAAPLLLTFGIRWALLANLVSYIASWACISSLSFADPHSRKDSTVAPSTFRADFVDGLREFRRNTYLTKLVCIMLVSALGTGALTPLLVFFVEDNLHTKATMLGILTMGFAAGSVLGSLLAGRLVARLGARRLTWLGLVCSGLLMLVFARQNHFVPAVVIFFVTALPVSALNVGLGPQLMASTPAAFMGRVMAILSPMTMIAAAVSLLVSGWLTSTVLKNFHAGFLGFEVGPIDLVYSISALLILSAGITAWRLLPERPAVVDAVDDEAPAT